MLNPMPYFRSLMAPTWPDAKPLPAHVQAVTLDAKLLMIHMEAAHKPSERTEAGYSK